MKSTEKQWIDTILNSANGINQAEPNPFLFAKIQHRLTDKPTLTTVPARTLRLAIGSFALLLLLNALFVGQTIQKSRPNDAGLSAVVTEMQLYSTQHELYAQ